MTDTLVNERIQRAELRLAQLAAAVGELGVNTVALAMALLEHELITEAQLETYKQRAAEAIRQALTQ